MSVLSRQHAIPFPRNSREHVALDAARSQHSGTASTGPSRTALLISAAMLVAAATVGVTTYVLAQDNPASPSGTVELPFHSEVQRDRATAARGGTAEAVARTEAQRDAAAAARHASR